MTSGAGMVDAIQIKKQYRGHFLIDERLIQQVQKHVLQFSHKSFRATFEFKGERTISSNDIDAIFCDSYIANSAITSLELEVGDFTDSAKCRVLFTNTYNPPIQVEIKGSRDASISLENSISNEITGAASFLWPPSHNVISGWFTGIALVLSICFVMFVFYASKSVPFWLLLLFLAMNAVSFAIGVFGQKLLPSIDFDFGYGRRVYGRRMRVFKFIFGGVGFAILIGVIGNLVSKQVGI
ncbi:hypothetical protein [Rhizobium changzhiense]|uniref:Uncharacterized protein n=1 Tax=Rhizobium changzhiense TaxID=2692317 RepID=A0ABR6AFE2_9HYPH|nr:hypothetical protein [Rhizobium changzhiense]MBA5805349.1 hypothetical protein [Rhizobium changzhiense]